MRLAKSDYRILCVEPDAQALAMMEKALTGYRLVLAVNGFEALREMNRGSFHAYVLDYWLPNWSGLDVCRHIRRSDPKVPVIFCAGAGGDARARAVRAGASELLDKPVDPPLLRRRLRALLEVADFESKRAHVEERLAIDDELRRRMADAMARTGLARLSAARAIERSARAKALADYLKAGGGLAYFDAAWGPTFSSAWQTYDPLRPIGPSDGLQASPN
jgi:DNA-binding response OmpR family regulator